MIAGDTLVIVALEVLNAATILALLALGLAVVFGMMRIVNLAHGEFLTIGAFTTLAAVRYGGLPLWLGMLLAAVVAGLVGIVVERLVIRPLYGRPLDVMLATWGISLLLVGTITVLFGPVTHGLPYALGSFTVGRYQYSEYRIAMTGIVLLMMVGVHLLFRRTRFGRHARATIGNPEMAAALGINTGRMFMLTFGLGCALAGAAGAVLSPLVGVVPTMGVLYIARAFITVIVGGPVALAGTAEAASLLGTIGALVAHFPLFRIATPGLCTPAPCVVTVGGSAFFGEIALLVFAVLLLRVMPEGLTGGRGRRH